MASAENTEKKLNTSIWVDADACPNVIKNILFKAADKHSVKLVLVANHRLNLPPSRFISSVLVEKGFDVADDYLVSQLSAGDLIVTSDIPLASEALNKKANVVTPRGDEFTSQNIKERLNMRDFMDTMRSSGIHTGGPAALTNADKHSFARVLDIWLHKRKL